MEVTQHARYTCTFCGKVSRGCGRSANCLLTVVNASGFCEEDRCWDLELSFVQENNRRWRLDSVHHGCCYYPQVRLLPRSFLFLSYHVEVILTCDLYTPHSTIRRLREITEA